VEKNHISLLGKKNILVGDSGQIRGLFFISFELDGWNIQKAQELKHKQTSSLFVAKGKRRKESSIL